LFSDPFWLRKITTDPPTLAHVNINCPDDVSRIKYLYLRTDFAQLEIRTGIICNNSVHVLALITMTVARFVVTGGFLNTYFTERIANYRSSSIIKKSIILIKKLSNLQSRRYMNVSTDPLGNDSESLGIREAHFGNRWYIGFQSCKRHNRQCTYNVTERDSIVGIATRYRLKVPRTESRWGELFRTCPGRPWNPLRPRTMGTGSLSQV